MLKRLAILIPIAVLAFVFLTPSTAEARKRGLMFINTGDDVFHLGDSPKEFEGAKKYPKVGYLYKRFGILWVNFWTWGGEFCVYNDNNEAAGVTQEQATQLLGKEASVPFTYRVPPGILVILAIVGVIVVSKVRSGKAGKELAALFDDPRYKKALEILGGEGKEGEGEGEGEGEEKQDSEERYRAALKYLTDQGIPRQEAEKNLGGMVQAIVAAQQQG